MKTEDFFVREDLLRRMRDNEIREEGREEGLEEGRRAGREEEKIVVLHTLMETMKLTEREAMDVLKIPPDERNYLLAEL